MGEGEACDQRGEVTGIERATAVILILAGALLILAALALPLGYFMAESQNTGLLLGWMAALLVVGLALVALGRAVIR